MHRAEPGAGWLARAPGRGPGFLYCRQGSSPGPVAESERFARAAFGENNVMCWSLHTTQRPSRLWERERTSSGAPSGDGASGRWEAMGQSRNTERELRLIECLLYAS